jgi:hypothetical protein
VSIIYITEATITANERITSEMYKTKVDKRKIYLRTKLGNLVALTLAAILIDERKKEISS